MKKGLLFELRRKAVHLLSLLFLVIYIGFAFYYGHKAGLLALTALLFLFLIIDLIRVELKTKIPILHIFWREKEKTRLGGQVYFLIAAIISFAVFDFNIAVAVLLMTTFGDMAGSLIGIKFGKHKMFGAKDRDWEGTIAEFAVDIIIGLILLDSLVIILGVALVATFVERISRHIDDNLLIPVVAGFVGQFLSMVL